MSMREQMSRPEQLPTIEQPSAVFGMTDLSEAFRSEGGAELRKAILVRIAELEKTVSAALKAGMSPAEFAGAEKIGAALVAARDVVVHFR